MPKHTPGPWKAQQDCRSWKNTGIFDGSNPDRQGNQNKWGIYGNYRIAEICEELRDYPSQEEVNANAHLMAAAPDLLNIVEAFMRFSNVILTEETNIESIKTSIGFYAPAISAAIKKAKGEINND